MLEFILTLFSSQHKLRSSTLFQLLKGKRTNSVLLFGFTHQLLPYLGLFPKLDEKSFGLLVNKLVTTNYLVEEPAGFHQLTNQGLERKAEILSELPIEGLDLFQYGRNDQEAWRLTKLSMQVVSFYQGETTTYVPIEARPFFLYQIKKWFLPPHRETVSHAYPVEMQRIFENLPQTVGDYLANQFSGQEMTGLTQQQLLPAVYQKQPWGLLYNHQMIHLFLAEISQTATPYLAELLAVFLKQNVNQSMLETRKLFLSGATKVTIMEKRHLKDGTINDHLLEWAIIDKSFPFEKFQLDSMVNHLKKIDDLCSLTYKRNQEYGDYLTFRLAQIYLLRERGWDYCWNKL